MSEGGVGPERVRDFNAEGQATEKKNEKSRKENKVQGVKEG